VTCCIEKRICVAKIILSDLPLSHNIVMPIDKMYYLNYIGNGPAQPYYFRKPPEQHLGPMMLYPLGVGIYNFGVCQKANDNGINFKIL